MVFKIPDGVVCTILSGKILTVWEFFLISKRSLNFRTKVVERFWRFTISICVCSSHQAVFFLPVDVRADSSS